MSQPQVQQVLRSANLKTPAGTKAPETAITARPWFANGIVQNQGACYEVRLRDDEADTMREDRDKLKSEIGIVEAKLKDAREHNAAAKTIDERAAELAKKKAEHDKLATELDRRAASWQAQVVAGLGDRIMKPGSEVLATTPARAVVTTLPTTRKPTDTELDKLNRLFRAASPDMIGLRTILQPDRSFAISIGAALHEGQDAAVVAHDACQRARALTETVAPKLVAASAQPSDPVVNAAEVVDVALVEDPVRNFVSVISRGVNFAISAFTEVPPPDLKLHALARGLCKLDTIANTRVDTLAGRNGVRIFVVANTATLTNVGAWQTKLLKSAPAEMRKIIDKADVAFWQARLLEQVRTEGASLKLTVLQPVVAKDIVPMQYNYMVGYIYVFIKVGIGFLLVLYFIRMERLGKVRKLGAEEAEVHAAHHKAHEDALAAAANDNSPDAPPAEERETYTPGYLMPKLLLTASGLLLTIVAVAQAWPSLRLLAYGQRGDAVAVAVIAHKVGLPEIEFKTQAELTAKLDEVTASKDYGWTFYNQFAFEPREGQQVTFRRDVGCKLRPTLPLLDDTGLPTAAPIRYDASHPELAILPYEYSTWFAPVLTGLLGLMTTLTGAILAWYARKPIILQSSAPAEAPAVAAAH